MNRREFLKRAGVGSVGLASLPALSHLVARPARAYEVFNFHFVARSKAATVGGVDHRILVSGDGKVFAGMVEASGTFVHFNAASPVPITILGEGTWVAKQVVTFDLIGTWGPVGAGVLDMLVDLIPDGAPPIRGAKLKMVCNIGAASLSTGLDEGFYLSIPRAPFGEFRPIVPADGLTVFSTGFEERTS